MEKFHYSTKGVCSTKINFVISNGFLKNVEFSSGCNGNLQGISSLVEGMPVEEVIKRLKGINCSGRGTSCPDQLVNALENAINKKAV